MQEFEINAENSFIGAWFIDDIDLCDELIDWFEQQDDTRPGRITVNEEYRIDESWKKSLDFTVKLPESFSDPIIERYNIELQNTTDQYIKKFPMSAETEKWNLDDFNIQKYEPGGGFYNWHSERTSSGYVANRHLAFMTYLNDITDAGETEFWHQKIKIKPQKGLTLIWPADWTHFHRGVPAPTETKYITTGWFSFLEEDRV